jgi:hypothetical protein
MLTGRHFQRHPHRAAPNTPAARWSLNRDGQLSFSR